MFENFDVWTVLTIILGAAAAFFGVYLLLVKTKLSEVVNLIKQLSEAGQALSDALEDNKISDVEKESLKKEWQDVKTAAKLLLVFKKS
jgi:predicted PurR-regulated permease PerM